MAKNWFVFYIKHTRNVKLLRDILDDGGIADYEIWTPTYRYITKEGGKEVIDQIPLFPGYALVHVEYDSSIGDALEQAKLGCVLDDSTVSCGGRLSRGKAVPLTEEEIERVKDTEKNYVEYSENASLGVNDMMKIERGPLLGLEGRVISVHGEDVQLEVFIFNRITRVSLKSHELRKVQRDS